MEETEVRPSVAAPTSDPIDSRQLRMILDAIPARIWVMDVDHNTLFANREAAELLGVPVESLIGRPTRDIVGAESFEADLPMRRRALAGELSSWSGWSTYFDGASRFTERVFQPRFDESGDVDGYYEFVRDATQEMRAQTEARRWAQLVSDALENLPQGVGVETADGRLALCNHTYAEIYDADPETLIGQSFDERLPTLLRRITSMAGKPFDSSADDALNRFADARKNITGPVEITLDDGRDLFVQRAHTSEGGRAVLMTDVTELRQREREGEQARHLLEDALEAVALGFAIFDTAGRLQMCNTLFRTMTALADVESGGNPRWMDVLDAGARSGRFVDPDGDPSTFAAMQERALADESSSPEIELADGRLLKVWRQATRQGGTVLTLTDVSETRRMERELRRSEDMVRQVLEACPVQITMVRASDGAVIYETQASREMMRSDQFRDAKSTKDRWLDLNDRLDYLRLLRARGVVDDFERQFRRGDGSVVWLSLSSRLINYRNEEVIVTSAYDLTERRAARQELDRQREIAQQAEKLGALGELLAGISHELNNPLSVLVGQAAILRETTQDEAVGRRAEKIAEAADRCARIVRSFLAMARQGPVQLLPVDANALVRSAIDIADAELRKAGVEIRLALDEDLPTLQADADQIRQVIVNLLVNASHALDGRSEPRWVRVATCRLSDSDMIRIEVRDSGVGVPDAIRSRIFEPLFTTKAVGHGTGIGLTLCHRIVSAHGGRIALAAPDNGGAAFVVDLPTAMTEDVAGELGSREDEQSPLRLLVVDDDESVRLTTSEVLQLDGHRVDCAGSAAEAIMLIDEKPYDVIISDVRMPETDGLAFYAMLRRDQPNAADRLVFATGDMLSPELGRALRATGRPCLEKPFLPSDIRRIVDDMARESAPRH